MVIPQKIMGCRVLVAHSWFFYPKVVWISDLTSEIFLFPSSFFDATLVRYQLILPSWLLLSAKWHWNQRKYLEESSGFWAASEKTLCHPDFPTMRSQFVAVFIVTYLAYYCDAAKRSRSKETNPKTAADERLRSLNTKYLTTNMVSLHDSNFSKFVTLRPRDYVAVLMFTALDARYNCEVCKASLPTFREVAALYYGQFDFNSSLPKDRLAFFIVDAGNAGGTFDDLKIETVPRFYVLPPRSEADSKLKMSDFEISNRYNNM